MEQDMLYREDKRMVVILIKINSTMDLPMEVTINCRDVSFVQNLDYKWIEWKEVHF